MSIRSVVGRIPVVGDLARSLKDRVIPAGKVGSATFQNSQQYWVDRYRSGGNSGAGSYRHIARFKADYLNEFVRTREVTSLVEFGSGDGNQLSMSEYPQYLGVDISPEAVRVCRSLFSDDPTKTFVALNDYAGERAQVALSLDVILHLVENETFHEYMSRLFDAAESYVVIYSTNRDHVEAPHVRHRRFTEWVDERRPEWELVEHTPNKHPELSSAGERTAADFFVYAPR